MYHFELVCVYTFYTMPDIPFEAVSKEQHPAVP
jgi:hypothetical protein